MTPDFDRGLSFRAFAALFAVLLAASSAPLLACDILPLVDYPNHLARVQLLASLAQSPVLQQFYTLAWRPIPDLAIDLVAPPLLRFLPLLPTGKLFVLASFALMAGGAAALHRVLFGRWSAWPCLAFLLLYGRLLLWGLLNYLFGIGLAVAALAGWIALAERGNAVRIVAGTIFALAVYLAHLMAFGVYAVLLLGYEAGQLLRRRAPLRAWFRAVAVAGLPLAVPLAIMALAGNGGGGGGVSFSHPWRKLDLLFSVFDLYHRPFDVACFVLAVIGLGWAYWRRWIALAPAMVVPLALLAMVYLAMPTQLLGASGADRRLPLALFLTLFGSSAWVPPRPRLERLYLGAAAAMLALRLATVMASWQTSDSDYRALLAELDRIPIGSRIAVAYSEGAVNVVATPLTHFPVLAVARRQAFVPTLFAQAGQQPVTLLPPFQALAQRLSPDSLWAAFVTGAAPLDSDRRAALAEYDYVVFTDREPFALASTAGLELAFQARRFALYRVAQLDGAGGRR
ncbi:MAG TPA: hypothetical protein VN832_07710 [Stellaceae bacterium]|nr:hypothetical protein [Stellaceae bacterium]